MPTSVNASHWSPRIALLVAATMFMEQLDATILVTAVPEIAGDLDVSSADVNITMTAYLITVATCIPLGGWLAGRFGARRIFCLAIGIFTLASLLCALSPNLALLTSSRVLQGFGGALMVPVGRLIVLRTTEKKNLLRSIAYITWPALLAPVLAPVVGGAITTYLSWHWIFLINIPLGAVALFLSLRLISEIEPGGARALDWKGLLWCSTAVFALIAGMEIATDPTLVVPAIAILLVAALSGTAGVRWLRRAEHPLLDLSTLKVKTFRVTNSGGLVYRAVINSAPFLLPLLFQDGFGWSPLMAGLFVSAVFIGNVAIKPTTTPLIRRFGFKNVLLGAILGVTLTFVSFAFFSEQTPNAVVFAVLLCSGAFRSIGFTAYNTVQFADIESDQMSSANTLSSTISELGIALGIALGALSVRAIQSGAGLFGLADLPLVEYRGAFLIMAALSIISLVSALRLPRDSAIHVSGRR